MSQSHGCATAQNFPDFAQNLKICMRYFKFMHFNLFNSFFFLIQTYYGTFCVISCAKFKNYSFDRAKKSTFRMSAPGPNVPQRGEMVILVTKNNKINFLIKIFFCTFYQKLSFNLCSLYQC